MAQNSTDLTGQQLGNYQLEELLKRRAATDLYLARDVKLDQPAYVEVLRTPVAENPELAGRFQRRMETVAQLKRANIASVIEVGVTEDGHAYAVIEYFDGVWMSDLLETWREQDHLLNIGEALVFGREIADALSTGHSAGLIHHDLRPENILVTNGGSQPILLDLGVPLTTNSRNGMLSESRTNMLDYASPEELDGKAIGRRSNIYSTGIILYELLTSHRPELPSSSWDIFEHSTMPKEVPLEEAREGLSGETYRLVRNCLWRQEWSRFETADEVISAIDTAMLAEQTVPKTAIWSDGRRRWLYIAVPALALLVLVVGLILLWSQFVSAGSQSQDASSTLVAVVTGEVTNTTDGAAANTEEAPGIVEVDDPLASVTPATATATLTREAPPTSAVDTTVPVFGPMADQAFGQNDTISFAWIWLSQPNADESFTVYIVSEDDVTEPIAIGSVDEPDNASLYRLDTTASELSLPAGSYLWQVRLENLSSGATLGESDARRFFIAEEPTPTPTDIPPTATPEPTDTSVPPSPTATTVVCVPSQPFGWLIHSVQSGETISLFAQQANVGVQRILEANCLPRGAVLSVGQTLFIPPPLATATNTPRPFVPAPTATPVPPPSGGGGGGGGGNDGGGSEPPTSEPPPPAKTLVPPPTE